MKDNPIWLVAIFAVLLGLGSRTATATEIDVLVDRYRAPIVMEAVDPATPDALESVVVLDQTVSELLATQITDPDAPGYGGWDPDMNINSQEISYNGQYFRRTQHLAWAWACPASSHYQSSEVATSLNLALEAGLPLLEMHSHPGNWAIPC